MNTLSLLVLSGLTVFACDAQQLRGSASSEENVTIKGVNDPFMDLDYMIYKDVSIDFGNSTNVTLGSTSGSCDTSGWDSHFASDAHACGMQSLGQQRAAGSCAKGKFHTSWRCANCIGEYIACSAQKCSGICCLGQCVNKYECKKCASDNCVWKLKRCTGGFVPSGYWVR